MSTPTRKLWSGWSLTPRKSEEKGKGLDFAENSRKCLDGEESGSINLQEKVAKLETELFEYQYNMGLLLIEKKEWTTKYEEVKHALEEANDSYKREREANSIAISEAEKREDSLRKALGVEKQCVLDLEKALREMRSEYAEIKFTADSKLAEANALVTSVEEKSLEVEAKLHAADAKLAEASRKSSEVERKLHELKTQENALRRERSSFNVERESHESTLSKQREDLREWERKLQEGEERLADGRRLLNQREQRANEADKIMTQKQTELEASQRKIDTANSVLNEKEEDISRRLAGLSLKEKEIDEMRKSLDLKEKKLHELEEKLDAKEREEIQKLVDEHKATLDAKEEEFKLEMKQRRESQDEELKSKVIELEKKEAEIYHMEEKVKKREQALEKKSEKVKEKEKDLESKLKALKEREKSVKVEEKNLANERKQILSDKDELIALQAELENVRADIEKSQLKLNEDQEQLKITEAERLELTRLQSELKQETDKCRLQQDLLLKETEDLKKEREKFEKEWDELDVKRAEIKKELEELNEQKRSFEKLKRSEEERMNKEKIETEYYVNRELEALKVARESFSASMDHEKSVLDEKLQNERSQLIHDFELRKSKLEADMQKKQEEMESGLLEREKLFEDHRERELNNINYLREVARRDMEELKLERSRLQKEKQEISANKEHLEEQQLEMRRDIDALVALSSKLKAQRVAFLKEREQFVEFIKKQENCTSCGKSIGEFELSGLQSLTEVDNFEDPPLPTVAQDYLRENIQGTSEMPGNELSPGIVNSGVSVSGGGTMSWLRKCTSKILKFSPGKKIEPTGLQDMIEESALPENSVKETPNASLLHREIQQDMPLFKGDASEDPILELDNSTREVETGKDIVEDSENSNVKIGQRRSVKRGGVPRGRKTSSGKANGSVEISINTNEESEKESGLLGTGVNRNSKKRSRAHASQGTASEQGDDYSEGNSDSVTGGSRRKRRQKAAPLIQNPGQSRYNLRRPKSAAVATTNGSLSHNASRIQETRHSKVAQTSPLEIIDGEVQSVEVVHQTVVETPIEIKDAAADKQDSNAEMANNLVDIGFSEEVNETSEVPKEDYDVDQGYRTDEDHGIGDNDEGDEDEEAEHPGEVSIGKKIWTFITT
nr:protein CROWDED NUCLEI 1-like [Ipomoea batatas]